MFFRVVDPGTGLIKKSVTARDAETARRRYAAEGDLIFTDDQPLQLADDRLRVEGDQLVRIEALPEGEGPEPVVEPLEVAGEGATLTLIEPVAEIEES